MSSFGEYLKGIRGIKGLSQQALADELKVSISTIRKIETGKSNTPKSKLLAELARFTNKSMTEVMEDIFFLGDERRKIGLYDFGFKFLSFMYINGWNFDPLKRYYYPGSDIPDVYLGLLTKKRQPTKCFVKMIGDYPNIYLNREPEILRQFLFDQIIFATSIEELKGVNNYIYLCNNNIMEESETFDILAKFRFEGLKLNIKVVLYDAIGNDIVCQSQVTGINFNLKDKK